ncbi:MAG: serpin family protein [Clostridia bacterium]|nr:serpin family protein [Clostridia bacterium]
MKQIKLRRILCLTLFAAMLFAIAGCNTSGGPRATHEPLENITQPPLPDDYDRTEAGIANEEDGIKYLTSSAFTSTRAAGEVSDRFRAQYSDFAVKLLKECADGKTALVSPLSVLTALLMTANGAQGKTLDEMMAVLGGNIDRDELNQQLFNYYESLTNTDDAKFHSANAVWFTDNPSFKVNNGFVSTIENTFRAQLAKVSFTDKATVDAINRWCSDNTDEMIKKILDYDDVGDTTAMVLANALCFDALWMEQYEDYQVSEMTFHGVSGDTKVKMMKSEESGLIKGAHETGFVKYYRRGRYAFVALLPEKGMSIDDYLATLSGEELMSLLENRDYDYDVNAGLPKFSFDWDGKLSDVLADMGIVEAFDQGKADFSALGELENGNLFIQSVLHKTHIEVDESGTRAAAVTAVMVGANGMPVEKKKASVILDRPFVFAIIDTSAHLPLFIGTVTDI